MAGRELKTTSEFKDQDLCLSPETNMLLCTFQHLKGISKKKEQDLWREGIIYWKDFESVKNKLPLLKDICRPDDSFFKLSRIALAEENTEFFAKMLPSQEHYRIALTFPQKTLFLDIETTGLSRYYDTITIVGWSLGKDYKVFIKCDDDKILRKAISQAKVIVTFNGSLFDLPFLRQEFQDLNVPLCHVDLRFLARRVGLFGGQKTIEKVLGIERPRHISRLKGETAPILWYKYCWGDQSALEQLIAYNHSDIEGMKVIFDLVVDRLLEKESVPMPARSVFHFFENRSELNLRSREIKPYREEGRPSVSLKDLLDLIPNRLDFRVVGIDLTGGEARPSGWCLLSGNYAVTECIKSDTEIFEATIKARPNLVSIDSPLSLPSGRISTTDDDPGREKYGITRLCERELKRRGINVYPSLIPSMQKLTARGIKFATKLRSLGIPVIESYPGAAQDVMGIPRKRASLEFLAKGLHRFGVEGPFVENSVCHDELDAITSALVAYFFWSGKFEPLGNEEEEFLIIPDIKEGSSSWRERKVIGFSGSIAAGKTTAGNFLKLEGFNYGRFSMVLENLLRERGQQISRQALQQIGEEINKGKQQRWLCKKLVKMLPNQGNLAIDGLRHPEDHAFLAETFGPAFLHIHIVSPENTRLERYIIDGGTKEEFFEANSHQVESNVPKLSSLAHIVLDNASDMDSFKNEILNTVNLKQDDKGDRLLCQ